MSTEATICTIERMAKRSRDKLIDAVVRILRLAHELVDAERVFLQESPQKKGKPRGKRTKSSD
jgi:hypothetical protein